MELCGEGLLLTCLSSCCRLGTIHGMDAQRRDPVDKQEGFQCRRRGGGCGDIMTGGVYGLGGAMSTYCLDAVL